MCTECVIRRMRTWGFNAIFRTRIWPPVFQMQILHFSMDHVNGARKAPFQTRSLALGVLPIAEKKSRNCGWRQLGTKRWTK